MSDAAYSRRPRAEQHVDRARAEALIRAQFAPLPERSIEPLSEGWDYAVYLVDDVWAFRFPRREVVVPGTEREIAVLPLLEVPAAVPRPELVGVPDAAFPWPFYGARYIRGEEPLGLDDDVRAGLARPLARFLRALHDHELDLPVDLQRRSDMTFRVPRARQGLAEIADLWQAPPRVEEVLREAEALLPAEPTAVVHGDLHFRQVLVHEGELSGVIDWVDVCRADPGQDFVPYWSLLPPRARAELLDEYGPMSEESLLRGRVLALGLNAALLRYGRDEGLRDVESEALASLERTASD
ncbi:MAG TPA: phosphotransferase [Gaiellaceae bacterium]|nr:phosphotransferase [Gaiellaceae bacterium]